MCFGLTIGVFGIAAGAYVAISGEPLAGSAISGVTLVSLVGSFIYGSRTKRNEAAEKNPDKR